MQELDLIPQCVGTGQAAGVAAACGGTTTVIHLTGIPAATDGAVFSVNSFNTAFGAGSLA